MIAAGHNLLAAHPSVAAKNTKELIAYAKANPGKLTMGSAGTGSVTHLAGELFKLMAGIEVTHVPYKGGGPNLNALIGGEIQISVMSLSAAIGQVKTGRLKSLGITSLKRSVAVPDIPTVAESGLPVVLGGTELILREELNMGGVQCTMHGVAPLMIVNGPYANKIGIHGGNGCFGPGFRANATIGRAIRLMLLNLGGGIAGRASATVFASPLRYTACLAENIERSPWASLAESRGYSAADNVITAANVESPRLHFDDVSKDPERLLTGIGDAMAAAGSWNMWFASNVVVAMGPQHAKLCADAGMSRSEVHRRLCELGGRRQGDLKRGGN